MLVISAASPVGRQERHFLFIQYHEFHIIKFDFFYETVLEELGGLMAFEFIYVGVKPYRDSQV
jgi:hypothetical protein